MNPYDMWAFGRAVAGVGAAGIAVVAVVTWVMRKIKAVAGGFE